MLLLQSGRFAAATGSFGESASCGSRHRSCLVCPLGRLNGGALGVLQLLLHLHLELLDLLLQLLLLVDNLLDPGLNRGGRHPARSGRAGPTGLPTTVAT